jgi:hypothetical protein
MEELAEEHLQEALHQEPLLTRSLRVLRRNGPDA